MNQRNADQIAHRLAIAGAMRLYIRMPQIIGKFTPEDQDLKTVFAHAKRLEGETLRAIAALLDRPDLLNRKGKGVAGQMLHAWFGVGENDSRSEPDLLNVKMPDGRTAGIEIKVVPLKAVRGGIRVKERCKVTSIEYTSLLGETWSVSRARHKLLVTLFIYYHYAGAKNWPDSTVDRVVCWQLEKSPARHTIESDWERTWHFVRDGRAHEISEGQAAILGASTAGAGKASKWVAQPTNPSVKARKRAFALKPAFLQTAYGLDKDPSAYERIPTSGVRDRDTDVRDVLLRRLGRYVGRRLEDIADDLGIPDIAATGAQRPKHAASLLIKRVLGAMSDDKKLLELEALGIKPKTIPARYPDMKPFEAMSFPAMKLVEFAEETWEDSDLRAHLENILMIPLFRREREDDYRESLLGKPFFWTPIGREEDAIAREWRLFNKEVRQGRAAYTRVNGRRVSSLTPASATTYIHLRPKGKDGSEDDIDPQGKPAQKLCFWLNQSFVQRLMSRFVSGT
jgi:DNA mismatch repair protein MutH